MSRLTISMPDQMSEWVEAQISAGRYGNVSEYFRDLVRRDQERRESATQELRALIERAEASSVSDRSLPGVLEAAREEARQKGLLPAEAFDAFKAAVEAPAKHVAGLARAADVSNSLLKNTD